MITDTERVARALHIARMWHKNLTSVAARSEAEGRAAEAQSCRARAMDLSDLIKILDGSEDEYIARVLTMASE